MVRWLHRPKDKSAILKQYQDSSNAGYRTLGVAYKQGDAGHNFIKDDEKGMIFIGFITFVLTSPTGRNGHEHQN